MTIAMTLAAMNNDLMRLLTRLVSPRFAAASSSAIGAGGGAGRELLSFNAVWAARRAAAIKPDLLCGASADCEATPATAASEAAIRVAGSRRSRAGPEFGSIG